MKNALLEEMPEVKTPSESFDRKEHSEHSLSFEQKFPDVQSSARTKKYSLRTKRLVSLLLADGLAFLISIVAAFLLSHATRVGLSGDVDMKIHDMQWTQIVLVFGIPMLLLPQRSWVLGHYTRFRPTWTELKEVWTLCLLFSLISVVVLFSLKLEFSRLWLGFFLVILCILIPVGRYFAKYLMTKAGFWFAPTYVVGTGDNAMMAAAALNSDISLGHQIVGFIDLFPVNAIQTLEGKPVWNQLPENTYDEDPHLVFALDSLDDLELHRRLLNRYIAYSSSITIAPPINGLPLCGAEVINVFRHDTVLLKLQNNINNRWAKLTKRCFDLVFASLALILLSPLLLLVALIIWSDGGKPIYPHRRIGKGGYTFNCLKFRSMMANSENVLEDYFAENVDAQIEWEENQKLTNDPRVTRIGHFIRKTSLDELPQLFNVLSGEMSIVGPRPIVSNEVSKYGEYLPYYMLMVPGITGLWQSSGRSNTSYRERVFLDVWYSRNWSVWHDFVIVLRTFPALLGSVGAR